MRLRHPNPRCSDSAQRGRIARGRLSKCEPTYPHANALPPRVHRLVRAARRHADCGRRHYAGDPVQEAEACSAAAAVLAFLSTNRALAALRTEEVAYRGCRLIVVLSQSEITKCRSFYVNFQIQRDAAVTYDSRK